MTTEEFDIEFDLLYNNINSNQAPGLNALEKSIFLTQAQDMIIKELYEKTGFENDEATMEALSPIVKDDSITPELIKETKWYKVSKPKNLLYIVYEYASAENGCGENKIVEVVPVKHDDINRIIKNPFRSANNRRILRILEGDNIKLYSNNTIKKYNVKYIVKPNNIVLKDATSYGVEGYTEVHGSDLHETMHRTILLQAVQIAQAAWK